MNRVRFLSCGISVRFKIVRFPYHFILSLSNNRTNSIVCCMRLFWYIHKNDIYIENQKNKNKIQSQKRKQSVLCFMYIVQCTCTAVYVYVCMYVHIVYDILILVYGSPFFSPIHPPVLHATMYS